MSPVDELLTRKSMNPRFVLTPPRSQFCYNNEGIRIGMERLLDNLIRHMRAVEVAGVDMVHPGPSRLPQNSYRGIHVARRSPDLRAGKLHRPVTHPVEAH